MIKTKMMVFPRAEKTIFHKVILRFLSSLQTGSSRLKIAPRSRYKGFVTKLVTKPLYLDHVPFSTEEPACRLLSIKNHDIKYYFGIDDLGKFVPVTSYGSSYYGKWRTCWWAHSYLPFVFPLWSSIFKMRKLQRCHSSRIDLSTWLHFSCHFLFVSSFSGMVSNWPNDSIFTRLTFDFFPCKHLIRHLVSFFPWKRLYQCSHHRIARKGSVNFSVLTYNCS